MTGYAVSSSSDITIQATVASVCVEVADTTTAGSSSINFGELSTGTNPSTGAANVKVAGNCGGAYSAYLGVPYEAANTSLNSQTADADPTPIPAGVPTNGTTAWGIKVTGTANGFVADTGFDAAAKLTSGNTGGGKTLTETGVLSSTGDTYTVDAAISVANIGSLDAGTYSGDLLFVAVQNP
jgi:hypothetical protein